MYFLKLCTFTDLEELESIWQKNDLMPSNQFCEYLQKRDSSNA